MAAILSLAQYVNVSMPRFVHRKSMARVHVYMESFNMLHITETPAYKVRKEDI